LGNDFRYSPLLAVLEIAHFHVFGVGFAHVVSLESAMVQIVKNRVYNGSYNDGSLKKSMIDISILARPRQSQENHKYLSMVNSRPFIIIRKIA
jgi:hypothetical protein